MTREVEAISPQDAIEKYNSRIYDDIDVKDIIDDGYWVRYKVMNIEVDDIVDIHATKAYKVKPEEGGGIRLVGMKCVSVVNGPIDSRNLHYHFIPEQQDHKSDFNCVIDVFVSIYGEKNPISTRKWMRSLAITSTQNYPMKSGN